MTRRPLGYHDNHCLFVSKKKDSVGTRGENSCPSGIVVRNADCGAVGPEFESRRRITGSSPDVTEDQTCRWLLCTVTPNEAQSPHARIVRKFGKRGVDSDVVP
ncbi:hypothetical protein TNCV_2393761 [Trichonephila clavipes]|nr:hypothetical protein TNCV_2393761 [Trichonephila clavipes]